jgi:hypothetical protein
MPKKALLKIPGIGSARSGRKEAGMRTRRQGVCRIRIQRHRRRSAGCLRDACTIRGTPCGSPTHATSRSCAGVRLVSACSSERQPSCTALQHDGRGRLARPHLQSWQHRAAGLGEIQHLNREKRTVQIGSAGREGHGDASFPRGPITQAFALRRSAEGGRSGLRRLGATCIAAMAIKRSPRTIT